MTLTEDDIRFFEEHDEMLMKRFAKIVQEENQKLKDSIFVNEKVTFMVYDMWVTRLMVKLGKVPIPLMDVAIWFMILILARG